MLKRRPNRFFYFLFAAITIFFLAPGSPTAQCEENAPPSPVFIGLYPTGFSRPASATSPVIVFEYKSELIAPLSSAPRLHLDALRLKNWEGEWILIAQDGRSIQLSPSSTATPSIDQPFFLRCMLRYSGGLHRRALEEWYAARPGSFPLNIPFPDQNLQEHFHPEVLLVPAEQVKIPRTQPRPSLIRRLFGAKAPKRFAPDEADGRNAPLNVVILMIDTLRFDHTPPGGHPFIIAPHIDQLASVGVHFTQAYGASSSTRPSVGSMLTGLHPLAHGAVRHATDGAALHLGVPFMPEHFLKSGYTTAAVSSNAQVSPAFGFKRGFKTFESSVDEKRVSERGLYHLRTLDEPFFLYLHYMGPHQPYTPSYPWKGLYKDQTSLRAELPSGKSILSASNALHDAYAEEITQEDRQIGFILRELSLQGLLDRTVLWLISDHGEEFWEHWWNGHGATLFQESVRTVAVLSAPSRGCFAQTVDAPFRHVDMLPTTLDLIGWNPIPLAHGVSFLPRILNTTPPENPQRPVFLHHGGGANIGAHPSDKEAVLLNRKKLIFWPERGRWEFYDLDADPFEQTDIFNKDDPDVQIMKPLLLDRIQKCRALEEKVKWLPDRESPSLTPEEIENLRNFGYL